MMPTPREGENQHEFISRCVPVVMEHGTAESYVQAVAVCHSIYRNRNKDDDQRAWVLGGADFRNGKIVETP